MIESFLNRIKNQKNMLITGPELLEKAFEELIKTWDYKKRNLVTGLIKPYTIGIQPNNFTFIERERLERQIKQAILNRNNYLITLERNVGEEIPVYIGLYPDYDYSRFKEDYASLEKVVSDEKVTVLPLTLGFYATNILGVHFVNRTKKEVPKPELYDEYDDTRSIRNNNTILYNPETELPAIIEYLRTQF